jgi:protein-tyrosine phosphatase
MPSVLFVCTANQFRSPLAAAFFHHHLQAHHQADGWNVSSAGTWTKPGFSIPSRTRRIAQRLKIVLLQPTTQGINLELLLRYDLILVMEANHKEALLIEFPQVQDRIYMLTEVCGNLIYDINDSDDEMEGQMQVAQEICILIDRYYQSIIELANRLCKSHQH